MGYISLQNHSEYSFYAGTPKVRDIVLRAKELGMKAIALTDTDRMSGLIVFYQLCREHGIKPILGVELTHPYDPGERLVLLAKDVNGYKDICELITQRHLKKDNFLFRNVFSKFYPDLFLITHSIRLLKELTLTPNKQNLYAALINQDDTTRQKSKEVEKIALSLNVPLVVTHNTFFLHPQDWELHKILVAIGLNSTLSRLSNNEVVPQNSYLKSCHRMEALFPRHHEALQNTERIADLCNVTLELGRWILPTIEPPKGHTISSYLEELALYGLEQHYGGKKTYPRARRVQEMELRIIDRLGYSSYFLMVKQIRDWANDNLKEKFRKPKDCTIMRGSAANSITFYNIGASDLDPIKYELYFQRFLNEDRASPPDADLDFGWDERDDAIDYFFERWGEGNVAVLCTTNHFKHRAAFREVAKVFGYSEEQISNFQKLQEPIDKSDLDKIHYYAERVLGKPRFLGQHPGGVIVTNDPIYRHVALERSGGQKDRVITQIDMHSGIDELGLIKFDILGNGSLSVLRDTLQQIREQGDRDPEVWNEEKVHHDPRVRQLIKNGRTRGIFYIESPAQTRLNKKARAETFEEIGITSSAVRPAGAYSTKVFVERHRKLKEGIKDWEYLHPTLESILHETHDCLIFQEDVIKICHQVAGMPYNRADRVRKMMNSMHEGAPDDYDHVKLEFINGCMQTSGLTKKQAISLWEGINTFQGFSFCKSHSLSYAQLSFKCTYLKAYYPAQLLAAVISNNHGFYSTTVYLNEARRFGVRINPFNINRSETKYVGKGMCITPGFMHIKGIRTKSLHRIEEEKVRNGPFTNLIDFIERTKIGRKEIESLIKVGAFDCFGLNQPELLSLLYTEYGKINSFEDNLFSFTADFREELHPELKDYTLTEKCLNELDLLGFMISGNILDILDLHPSSKHAVPNNEIHKYVNRRIRIFGNPITSREHLVGGKEEMKFITIEDKTGTVDVILWPNVYHRFKEISVRPGPYEIWGVVQEEWDTFSVIADTVRNVAWSPSYVDFELASKRLLKSYTEQFIYKDINYSGFAA